MTNQVKCSHTTLTSSCKQCRKLAAIWEKKLEKHGDGNIEQPDGNLKHWDSFRFGRDNIHLVNLPSREEYYRLAGQFLWEYKFTDKKQRRIWELHGTGLSVVDITQKLKSECFRTYKRAVHETIQALAKEMLEQCRNRTSD